ncbi:nucleoside-binding protein [Haloarcula vallismortis]|uniref:Membrane lipoprotein tmpC n=2 Tax=Haloarcula vallismortis TaxID=28442 RepID=M0JLY6_HALVA|nr:BMP family protein [Haloarcula vallismortis]EMA09368.1 membrane lipoprotein tmpC precursor [Haloarcula vallismortis ATCC 29715]SDW80991.1 nucleoside-binding protein [Haloarcula vallismortis]
MREQKITRRRLLASGSAAATATLAGCASRFENFGGSEEAEGSSQQATESAIDESDAAATVGMVYALGGLDDRSFNDAANRGIQRARLDDGVEYTNHEPGSVAGFADVQAELAGSTSPSYDLICCIGFLQAEGLSEVAPEYTDQQFMIVDSVVDADNVASYVFREHEGSFQAGNLAGLLTTRDVDLGAGATNPDETTVGFIGGLDQPLIHKFEAGFRAGVEHANADVDVLTEYLGNFDDVQGARDIAAEMYDDGADIVYHAAGGAGVGIFQAAQAHGRYAIGVDSDQSRSNPRYADVVLASMVKRVNVAVYDAATATVADSLPAGEVVSLGLDSDGVGVVYGTSLEPAIPDDVREALSTSREQIAAGDIVVPTERASTGGA